MAFRRIDRETVQRILDSANIVDVVSDFVSLKRRGANYVGLCPFHNERTPSFYVSPAKGICKCFSCGKSGSAVNFIMEHEQMTYNEALRYLAKKYNIEIQEHEMTDQERLEETERENMFRVNEFAMDLFEHTLLDTPDGRDIGLAYFRERGISDAAIKRFHLGYSLEKGNILHAAAIKEGYSEKALIDTGLCLRRDDGSVYDRFKGRVIYPVHTISGKVVAFGGRTLRSDKKIAKYVNSPESLIYKKNRELYGLYQAKKSIVEKKKCLLVEGYMDVISMSQLGIENIVASSGTSLTEGQIRLIHRFTDNVTVIYDSDPAGIKASLRGIDMLLAEGLNMKVVLLPDGDDPDSFAQSHTLTEVEQYITANEVDFIRFKTNILLQGSSDDPTRKAEVITDIVRSISLIPNEITRSVYVKECSRSLDIDEKVLLQQIKRFITAAREKQADSNRANAAISSLGPYATDNPSSEQTREAATPDQPRPTAIARGDKSKASILLKPEQDLLRYIIRYGMVELPVAAEADDSDSVEGPQTVKVLDYLSRELEYEGIKFANEAFNRVMEECLTAAQNDWEEDFARFNSTSLAKRQQQWDEGETQIRSSAQTLDQIKLSEKSLLEKIDNEFYARANEFTEQYLVRKLASCADDTVRSIATDLAISRHQLSKVHSRYTTLETERDRLLDLLPRALFALKDALLGWQIKELRDRLASLNNNDTTSQYDILRRILDLETNRREYARSLGERVVLPKQ